MRSTPLPSVMRRSGGDWQPLERLAQAVWPVAGIVTAFTVAHSITLALAATGVVSLSPRFIEPAIAVTIILTAFHNIRPVFRGRRAVVTIGFGLIHGCGFAGVLAELIVVVATTLLFSVRRVVYSQGFGAGDGDRCALAGRAHHQRVVAAAVRSRRPFCQRLFSGGTPDSIPH